MPSRARAADAADVAPLPVVAEPVLRITSVRPLGADEIRKFRDTVNATTFEPADPAYTVDRWNMRVTTDEPCRGILILRGHKPPPEVFNLRDFGEGMPDMRCNGKILTIGREAIESGSAYGYRTYAPSRDFTFTVDFVELR